MQLSELFHHELMILDLPTHEKSETLTYLANQFKEYGGVTNVQAFNDALENRESQSTTGVGDEIAIPHAQEASIKEPAIIFGRSQEGIEWDSFAHQKILFLFGEFHDSVRVSFPRLGIQNSKKIVSGFPGKTSLSSYFEKNWHYLKSKPKCQFFLIFI